jgi:hypothetical protein
MALSGTALAFSETFSWQQELKYHTLKVSSPVERLLASKKGESAIWGDVVT